MLFQLWSHFKQVLFWTNEKTMNKKWFLCHFLSTASKGLDFSFIWTKWLILLILRKLIWLAPSVMSISYICHSKVTYCCHPASFFSHVLLKTQSRIVLLVAVLNISASWDKNLNRHYVSWAPYSFTAQMWPLNTIVKRDLMVEIVCLQQHCKYWSRTCFAFSLN